MNLVYRYSIIRILKTLEEYLLSINQRNYKTAFARARIDLMKNSLCNSLSIQLKDKNTAMILAEIANKQYVLLWDLKKQKITHKGVKN